MDGFADDLTYTKVVHTEKDIEEAKEDLQKLCGWIEREGFRIQLKKTKYMVVSRKVKSPRPNITIGGAVVERVSSYKLLGVTVTDDLLWAPHILDTCVRAKRMLGCIYRNFRMAGFDCLNHIYKATVRPVLEYSAVVWDTPFQKYQEMLERVQSFAGRICVQAVGCSR